MTTLKIDVPLRPEFIGEHTEAERRELAQEFIRSELYTLFDILVFISEESRDKEKNIAVLSENVLMLSILGKGFLEASELVNLGGRNG